MGGRRAEGSARDQPTGRGEAQVGDVEGRGREYDNTEGEGGENEVQVDGVEISEIE